MAAVPVTASRRLSRDYAQLIKDPVPYVVAAPVDANVLEWRYVVAGVPATPYEGGCYHGKLVFPTEFPFKPPAIYMLTPSGRFRTNTRLCLSISDFHPDTWNPAWTVSTILTGLLSFMNENSPTHGSIQTSDDEKRAHAKRSGAFNLKDPIFCDLFPELAKNIRDEIKKERLAIAEAEASSSTQQNCGRYISQEDQHATDAKRAKHETTELDNSKLDLMLKDGQTVTVNIGSSSQPTTHRTRPTSATAVAQSTTGIVPLLPPPS